VLRSLLGISLLLLALLVELVLSAQLIGDVGLRLTIVWWLACHTLACAMATIAISALCRTIIPGRHRSLMLFLFCICFFIPFAGTVGIAGALTLGGSIANGRYRVPEFWQITRNVDLPYTAPLNRLHAKLDSRGIAEQLLFDQETDEVYKKVLSSRNIRNSESADVLKSAVAHPDERVRLTAFQAMDKKVSSLNRDIQRLEREAERSSGKQNKTATQLQIATNYLELLTLEDDEPVARAQLLDKAASAALQAITFTPKNPNAHFLFGRVALAQGENKRAMTAFGQAIKFGMSKDKVLPYQAEAAFKARDFDQVKDSLNSIDRAFTAYPPLRQVAEYWA